jgi:hypothetical protein
VTLAPLHGGCHCGHLSVELSLTQAPGALQPRACDCAFCTKHGAAWISDPAGALVIDVRGRDALGDYRQGSGSAGFLHCRNCGVLVAVVHDGEEGLRGAVNVRCLDEALSFGEPTTVSPQQLAKDDKIARWGRLWTPARIRIAS